MWPARGRDPRARLGARVLRAGRRDAVLRRGWSARAPRPRRRPSGRSGARPRRRARGATADGRARSREGGWRPPGRPAGAPTRRAGAASADARGRPRATRKTATATATASPAPPANGASDGERVRVVVSLDGRAVERSPLFSTAEQAVGWARTTRAMSGSPPRTCRRCPDAAVTPCRLPRAPVTTQSPPTVVSAALGRFEYALGPRSGVLPRQHRHRRPRGDPRALPDEAPGRAARRRQTPTTRPTSPPTRSALHAQPGAQARGAASPADPLPRPRRRHHRARPLLGDPGRHASPATTPPPATPTSPPPGVNGIIRGCARGSATSTPTRCASSSTSSA